jgi:lysophospholipase L1-like esterase
VYYTHFAFTSLSKRGVERAQEKTGFSFISVYDLFTEYLAQRNEKVDKYLEDGLHPNDEGYRVMFALISKAYDL